MIERKIDAMHKRFGTYSALCKECDHLIGIEYHDKHYYKCELYGNRCSEATDWRLSYIACGMFNSVPEHYDNWIPVIDQIKRERQGNCESPIPGQIDFMSLFEQ